MQTEHDLRSTIADRIRWLWIVAALLLNGCNPPFPGPPDELPSCTWRPAFELCTVPHDSTMRQVPFAR
jgi:hypothetical protein